MENLLESFKILSHIATQMKFMILMNDETVKNNDLLKEIKFDDPHFGRLTYRDGVFSLSSNYLLLLGCSYLDELNNEFVSHKHPSYAERIIQFRKIVKPALKRIDDWKDLKVFRNTMLAHGYRIKGKSVLSHDNRTLEFKIPKTETERKLFYQLVFVINNFMASEFKDIRNSLNFNETLLDKLHRNYVTVDVEAEINEVLARIQIVQEALYRKQQLH